MNGFWEKDLSSEDSMKQYFGQMFQPAIAEVLRKSAESMPAIKERGVLDVESYSKAEGHYLTMQRICAELAEGKCDFKSAVHAMGQELDGVFKLVGSGGINSRSFYADTCLNLQGILTDTFRDYLE